ncbi:MAG TPA: DUF932 domain-containing protein [Anaerohalosphaeraceae bacterium]|nr:DUF932 domain-containing protein [Anaerohalosphaeraceae bacterium]
MKNLSLITEQIREEYDGFKSYVIPSEKIALTEAGLFKTGKNEFPITDEGLDQFAGLTEIPKPFFRTLEPDLRSMVFNRRFQIRLNNQKIPSDIRINLNKDANVIGYDDPKLLRINPLRLMDAIASSLPKNLSPEQIGVAKADFGTNAMLLSCISPQNVTEPQPGDVINGGIDILHSISGHTGTQINCYIRRLICSNGATTHICQNDTSLRVRRLNNGDFDESDMLGQIQNRLVQVWSQIDEKLAAIKALTEKKRTSLDFLEQHRTRLSLNNNMIKTIRNAISQDEIGPTGTQYDLFNAISRVATHHQNLTFRQQRILSRLAGEFSQQDVQKCEHCGSWLTIQN